MHEQEADTMMAMINARNLASHIYREEFAEEVYGAISDYELLNIVLQRLAPSN